MKDEAISRQAAIDAMSNALERVFPEHRAIAERTMNKLPSVSTENPNTSEIEKKCDRINSLASVLPYAPHREIQELLCEIMDLCKVESEEISDRNLKMWKEIFAEERRRKERK